jgi:hypothetical protein
MRRELFPGLRNLADLNVLLRHRLETIRAYTPRPRLKVPLVPAS